MYPYLGPQNADRWTILVVAGEVIVGYRLEHHSILTYLNVVNIFYVKNAVNKKVHLPTCNRLLIPLKIIIWCTCNMWHVSIYFFPVDNKIWRLESNKLFHYRFSVKYLKAGFSQLVSKSFTRNCFDHPK